MKRLLLVTFAACLLACFSYAASSSASSGWGNPSDPFVAAPDPPAPPSDDDWFQPQPLPPVDPIWPCELGIGCDGASVGTGDTGGYMPGGDGIGVTAPDVGWDPGSSAYNEPNNGGGAPPLCYSDPNDPDNVICP